jgi:hypothetical protein
MQSLGQRASGYLVAMGGITLVTVVLLPLQGRLSPTAVESRGGLLHRITTR